MNLSILKLKIHERIMEEKLCNHDMLLLVDTRTSTLISGCSDTPIEIEHVDITLYPDELDKIIKAGMFVYNTIPTGYDILEFEGKKITYAYNINEDGVRKVCYHLGPSFHFKFDRLIEENGLLFVSSPCNNEMIRAYPLSKKFHLQQAFRVLMSFKRELRNTLGWKIISVRSKNYIIFYEKLDNEIVGIYELKNE